MVKSIKNKFLNFFWGEYYAAQAGSKHGLRLAPTLTDRANSFDKCELQMISFKLKIGHV